MYIFFNTIDEPKEENLSLSKAVIVCTLASGGRVASPAGQQLVSGTS